MRAHVVFRQGWRVAWEPLRVHCERSSFRAAVPSGARCGLVVRLMLPWRACLGRPSEAALAPRPQRRGSSLSRGPILARARAAGPSSGMLHWHATWRISARAWSRATLPTRACASGSSTISSRELPRSVDRTNQVSGRLSASLAPRCAGVDHQAASLARPAALRVAQVSLALRVHQRAAGGTEAPKTPVVQLGSTAGDGELSEAMRDYVKLQTAALERDKKDKKLSFCLKAPRARAREACAASVVAGARGRKGLVRFSSGRHPHGGSDVPLRGAAPGHSRAWQGGVAARQGLAKTARDRGRAWIGSPDGEDLQINFKPPWSEHQLGEGPGECCGVRARAPGRGRLSSACLWGPGI